MNPRLRRLIAAIGVVAFLAFYIWAAVAIGERLPDQPLIDLLFYALAGTGWALPLYPLLRWAERG